MTTFWIKQQIRRVKAYCIKYRRALRLQRWPVRDGTGPLDRMRSKLEKTLYRSKDKDNK